MRLRSVHSFFAGTLRTGACVSAGSPGGSRSGRGAFPRGGKLTEGAIDWVAMDGALASASRAKPWVGTRFQEFVGRGAPNPGTAEGGNDGLEFVGPFGEPSPAAIGATPRTDAGGRVGTSNLTEATGGFSLEAERIADVGAVFWVLLGRFWELLGRTRVFAGTSMGADAAGGFPKLIRIGPPGAGITGAGKGLLQGDPGCCSAVGTVCE
jgi:hypothetical protein